LDTTDVTPVIRVERNNAGEANPSPVAGPRLPSVADDGDRETILGKAIDRLTRALLTAPDDVLPEIIGERKALRLELEELRRGRNVLPFRRPGD
jgi:hypothetical protein